MHSSIQSLIFNFRSARLKQLPTEKCVGFNGCFHPLKQIMRQRCPSDEDNRLVVTVEILGFTDKLLAGEAREHTPLTDQPLLRCLRARH